MLSRIMLPLQAKSVTTTATSAQTSADFSEIATVVDLYATQACFFRFTDTTGLNTAAVNTDHYIGLGERLRVEIPSKKRLSAIRSTVDGVLYITEYVDPQNRRTQT